MDKQEIIFRARYINKVGPLKKENKFKNTRFKFGI